MSPPHTGREKVGSPTLHTHQDPILLLPCACFELAFQTLTQTRELTPARGAVGEQRAVRCESERRDMCMGGGARGVCGREQPPPTATLHRTLSGPSLPGWDVMGVMGMSHAGGEGWMGTQRPLPTTLGSVVEQGAQP